jgi:hypothetical protein
MQDKSINGALLALRKQIMRGKLDGLEHVEALLTTRGVHMPAVFPAKKADVAYRGQVRAMLCEALRNGPKTRAEILEHIAQKRPELPAKVAYARADRVMWKMRKAGLVEREGRVWRLAP